MPVASITPSKTSRYQTVYSNLGSCSAASLPDMTVAIKDLETRMQVSQAVRVPVVAARSCPAQYLLLLLYIDIFREGEPKKSRALIYW